MRQLDVLAQSFASMQQSAIQNPLAMSSHCPGAMRHSPSTQGRTVQTP